MVIGSQQTATKKAGGRSATTKQRQRGECTNQVSRCWMWQCVAAEGNRVAATKNKLSPFGAREGSAGTGSDRGI